MEIINFINSMPAQEQKMHTQMLMIIKKTILYTILGMIIISSITAMRYYTAKKMYTKLLQSFEKNNIPLSNPESKIKNNIRPTKTYVFDAFQAITAQSPEDISLKTITRNNNGSITMSGEVLTKNSVIDYVEQLKKNSSIEYAAIDTINQQTLSTNKNKKVYTFTLRVQEKKVQSS